MVDINKGLIIIETSTFMGEEVLEGLRKRFVRDREQGIIVLPWYCRLRYPCDNGGDIDVQCNADT